MVFDTRMNYVWWQSSVSHALLTSPLLPKLFLRAAGMSVLYEAFRDNNWGEIA